MAIRTYTRTFKSTTTQTFTVDTASLTHAELRTLDSADTPFYTGTDDPEVDDLLTNKGVFMWDEAEADERAPHLRIYRED